ncbi:hypothetical protein MTsN2n4_23590 [Pseudoalteromonas sp. MTN2-4]
MKGNSKNLVVLGTSSLRLVIGGIGTDPFDPKPPKKTEKEKQPVFIGNEPIMIGTDPFDPEKPKGDG